MESVNSQIPVEKGIPFSMLDYPQNSIYSAKTPEWMAGRQLLSND
jgi:hypothetical protein